MILILYTALINCAEKNKDIDNDINSENTESLDGDNIVYLTKERIPKTNPKISNTTTDNNILANKVKGNTNIDESENKTFENEMTLFEIKMTEMEGNLQHSAISIANSIATDKNNIETLINEQRIADNTVNFQKIDNLNTNATGKPKITPENVSINDNSNKILNLSQIQETMLIKSIVDGKNISLVPSCNPISNNLDEIIEDTNENNNQDIQIDGNFKLFEEYLTKKICDHNAKISEKGYDAQNNLYITQENFQTFLHDFQNIYLHNIKYEKLYFDKNSTPNKEEQVVKHIKSYLENLIQEEMLLLEQQIKEKSCIQMIENLGHIKTNYHKIKYVMQGNQRLTLLTKTIQTCVQILQEYHEYISKLTKVDNGANKVVNIIELLKLEKKDLFMFNQLDLINENLYLNQIHQRVSKNIHRLHNICLSNAEKEYLTDNIQRAFCNVYSTNYRAEESIRNHEKHMSLKDAILALLQTIEELGILLVKRDCDQNFLQVLKEAKQNIVDAKNDLLLYKSRQTEKQNDFIGAKESQIHQLINNIINRDEDTYNTENYNSQSHENHFNSLINTVKNNDYYPKTEKNS